MIILLSKLICLLSPTGFLEAWNFVKLVFLFLFIFKFESWIDCLVDHLVYLCYNGISLFLQNVRDIDIVDIFDDLALHHGAAIVVLNIALPPRLGHVTLLVKALLLEEFGGIVVCIGQEILKTLLLRMIFQLVHQAGTESSNLLSSCDGQENNLSKLLSPEGSEDATSQNLRSLSILPAHYDHGLMLSVHGEFDNVVAWHPRQLFGDNVLEFDQIPHALQCPL
jgi:hypothetical protein